MGIHEGETFSDRLPEPLTRGTDDHYAEGRKEFTLWGNFGMLNKVF